MSLDDLVVVEVVVVGCVVVLFVVVVGFLVVVVVLAVVLLVVAIVVLAVFAGFAVVSVALAVEMGIVTEAFMVVGDFTVKVAAGSFEVSVDISATVMQVKMIAKTRVPSISDFLF